MSDTSFDISQLSAMMENMGISPESLLGVSRDPSKFHELLSSFGARGEPHLSAFRGSDPAGLADGMIHMLENAKATHAHERSLPPAKASESSRAELLREFEGSSKDRSTGPTPQSDYFVRQTYIGVDPEFSETKLENLNRICISQMLVRKRHEGDYLLCRIISKTRRSIAVSLAIEDPEGGTTKLGIYHYPYTLDAKAHETDEIFPIGTLLAIREPYYKFSAQGDVPLVRVDSPSDIVFLQPDSSLVQGIQWATGSTLTDAPRFPTNPAGWKDRGVEHFKRQSWHCAAISFSEGLKLDPKNHLLLLNRAEMYLRLGWNIAAAHDAEAVISMNLDDAGLRLKAVFRAAKARYGSGDHKDVIRLSEMVADDSDLKALSARAKKRMREASTGEYDWVAVYKECQKTAPRPDIASYQGPVKVQTPGNGGPRGLFATRDVKVGELLVVSKPIVSYYPADNPNDGKEIFTSLNLLTNTAGKRSDYALIDNAVQRMWDDAKIARLIRAMYAGQRFPTETEYPVNPHTSIPLSHPLSPSTDIDIARLEGVCSVNVFRIEDVSPVTMDPEPDETELKDAPRALYELPSFCNHSCVPTANRMFFGDAMVIRAVQSLKAGDEVTLSYTVEMASLGERSNLTERTWGFSCSCPLCQADRSDGSDECATRKKLNEELENPLLGIPRAKKIVEEVKATYRETPERLKCSVKTDLIQAYNQLGLAYGRRARATSSHADCKLVIQSQMDALASAGLAITDRSISGRLTKSSATSLPVDKSKPPYSPGFCTGIIVQMASNLDTLNEEGRAARWLKVAVWLHNNGAGGGRALFLERFRPVLTGLGIINLV